LLTKLIETAAANRQPVLIAPKECIEYIRYHSPKTLDSLLVDYCDYVLFTNLLLDAEYVFYWNIFSNSISTRVVNNLPVFFFDIGHLARTFKPLFQLGIQTYYPQSQLIQINMETILSLEQLQPLALSQEKSLKFARDNFKQSPNPQEIVMTILLSSQV